MSNATKTATAKTFYLDNECCEDEMDVQTISFEDAGDRVIVRYHFAAIGFDPDYYPESRLFKAAAREMYRDLVASGKYIPRR